MLQPSVFSDADLGIILYTLCAVAVGEYGATTAVGVLMAVVILAAPLRMPLGVSALAANAGIQHQR